MTVSTLSAKHKISIPKDVRDRNGWRPGQKFAFVARGEGMMLVPVPDRDALFGIAKGADVTEYRDRKDRY